MPRTSHKQPCRFCSREIDTRGKRMHETACKDNPANHEEAEQLSKIRQIDANHLNGNLQVFMECYRAGVADGFQFASEKKAA